MRSPTWYTLQVSNHPKASGRDLGRLWYWQNAPVVPAPVAEKSH